MPSTFVLATCVVHYRSVTRVGIVAGAAYYSVQEGVWSTSDKSVSPMEKIKNKLIPTACDLVEEVWIVIVLWRAFKLCFSSPTRLAIRGTLVCLPLRSHIIHSLSLRFTRTGVASAFAKLKHHECNACRLRKYIQSFRRSDA